MFTKDWRPYKHSLGRLPTAWQQNTTRSCPKSYSWILVQSLRGSDGREQGIPAGWWNLSRCVLTGANLCVSKWATWCSTRPSLPVVVWPSTFDQFKRKLRVYKVRWPFIYQIDGRCVCVTAWRLTWANRLGNRKCSGGFFCFRGRDD